MAYERNFGVDHRFGGYDNVFTNFELSSSPFPTTTSTSTTRRDSVVSSNSILGSDTSGLTAGPMTPVSHGQQAMLLDDSSDPTTSSMSYNDVSALVGLNALETFGQEGIGITLRDPQDPLSNKLPQTVWDGNLISMTNDVTLGMELHQQQSGAFSAPPPTTPQYGSSGYGPDTFFGSVSSASTSPCGSFLSSSSGSSSDLFTPSTTVSPSQIYSMTPSSPILGEPFTTPVKREREDRFLNRLAALPTRLRQEGSVAPPKLPLYDSDLWSVIAQDGSNPLASSPLSTKFGPYPTSTAKQASLLDTAGTTRARTRSSRRRTSPNAKGPGNAARARPRRKAPFISIESKAQYVCTVCSDQRRFKRQEHLNRHMNSTHNKNAVYPCELCAEEAVIQNKPEIAKCFDRKDNLKQHIMKTHLTYSDKGRSKRLVDERDVFDDEVIARLEWTEIKRDMLRNREKRDREEEEKGEEKEAAGSGTGKLEDFDECSYEVGRTGRSGLNMFGRRGLRV